MGGNKEESFCVKFSYQGRTATVSNVTHSTTSLELLSMARRELNVDDDNILLKLLFKGKIICQDKLEDSTIDSSRREKVFPAKIPKGVAKVIVMGTPTNGVARLNSQRSDPTIRGFEDRPQHPPPASHSWWWGPLHARQHSEYKICRFQECTDASFGSRPGSSTPHAFEARRLLERLATDPGIVAILVSRELVVGTLGEMDPVDDRLMQKKAQEGACLLGYNTNAGMRIDIKLRTDDLAGFRPYDQLVSTLIHELSHNWVAEHNVLFWTNFGHMRMEYLWKHASLMMRGDVVQGKPTATLAGVSHLILPKHKSHHYDSIAIMKHITRSVLDELTREMAQHRLPVEAVSSAMVEFGKQLLSETKENPVGQRLGGRRSLDESERNDHLTARERALAAAEKRKKEGDKNH